MKECNGSGERKHWRATIGNGAGSVNERLEPKLRRELRPGTRIVSHQFTIGEWPPNETLRVDDEDLFLWIVPAQ